MFRTLKAEKMIRFQKILPKKKNRLKKNICFSKLRRKKSACSKRTPIFFPRHRPRKKIACSQIFRTANFSGVFMMKISAFQKSNIGRSHLRARKAKCAAEKLTRSERTEKSANFAKTILTRKQSPKLFSIQTEKSA